MKSSPFNKYVKYSARAAGVGIILTIVSTSICVLLCCDKHSGFSIPPERPPQIPRMLIDRIPCEAPVSFGRSIGFIWFYSSEVDEKHSVVVEGVSIGFPLKTLAAITAETRDGSVIHDPYIDLGQALGRMCTVSRSGFDRDRVIPLVPLWMNIFISICIYGIVYVLVSGVCVLFQRSHNRGDCCTLCGYNLAGRIANVCPECGTAAPLGPNTRSRV